MTDSPQRIQLRRTKGWRMPSNTVKVDRTTKWGNPFVVGQAYDVEGDDTQIVVATPAEAVATFRDNLDDPMHWHFLQMLNEIDELRGKNLACWCPLDQPCHADVLLEMANRKDDGDD